MKTPILVFTVIVFLLYGWRSPENQKIPDISVLFITISSFNEIPKDTLPILPADYEVQLQGHQDEVGYQYSKISFIDRISGEVVNVFDVIKNQPFSFEGYEYMDKYAGGYRAYRIPSGISERVSGSYRSETIYNTNFERIEPDVELIYLRSWVSAPPYNNTEYTIVFYQVLSYGRMPKMRKDSPGDGFRTGGHTFIIILNGKGEKVSAIKDIPECVGSTDFSITQDGKYLGIISGIGEDEDSPFIVPKKWHIIDVVQEKIVIEKEEAGGFLSSDFNISPPFVVATSDKLVLNRNKCRDGYDQALSGEFAVFDFQSKTIFFKCYQGKFQGYFPWIWLPDAVVEKDFYTGLPDRKRFYYSDFRQAPLLFDFKK
ncbi:MAG: hypothetical protein WA008_07465 [Saprospiraceae bacterium]|jgi:hypothetical protein